MKNTIRLRPDLRDQVKTLLLLKDHHLTLAAQHEAQVYSLLKVACGIDLNTEHWTLDEKTGTLSRDEVSTDNGQ